MPLALDKTFALITLEPKTRWWWCEWNEFAENLFSCFTCQWNPMEIERDSFVLLVKIIILIDEIVPDFSPFEKLSWMKNEKTLQLNPVASTYPKLFSFSRSLRSNIHFKLPKHIFEEEFRVEIFRQNEVLIVKFDAEKHKAIRQHISWCKRKGARWAQKTRLESLSRKLRRLSSSKVNPTI